MATDPQRPDVSPNHLARRYRQGARLTDLAREFRMCRMTIRRQLRAVGVEIRPRGPITGKPRAKVVDLAEGVPAKELCCQCDLMKSRAEAAACSWKICGMRG